MSNLSLISFCFFYLRHLRDDDANTARDVDLSMKSKCSTPNTPRRSPEVHVVTAFPPGFSEEQEERGKFVG